MKRVRGHVPAGLLANGPYAGANATEIVAWWGVQVGTAKDCLDKAIARQDFDEVVRLTKLYKRYTRELTAAQAKATSEGTLNVPTDPDPCADAPFYVHD